MKKNIDQVKIHCLNNNAKKKYEIGTSLKEILADQKLKGNSRYFGALVNNKIKELSFQVFKPKDILFINIEHPDGVRMYVRSLSFVLLKAVKELFPPEARLRIDHSISNGLYCEIENIDKELTFDRVFEIQTRMRKIIEKDLIFTREEVRTNEAIKLFEENNFPEKALLFKTRVKLYTSVYKLADQVGYFYGYLVPSTGYLKVFDLVKYYDGMLLRIPKKERPSEVEDIIIQNKLFEIFREHKNWVRVLDTPSIGSLNQKIKTRKIGELIKISEALHEKKVARIADSIATRRKHIKLVLISGPSSSGKTTFSKRLGIQLKVAGLKPFHISLDDYFVDREKNPVDENGKYDFESLKALDVKLFNKNLIDLFAGKKVSLPKFSFETGKRYYDGTEIQVDQDHIIIVEGIHGLNPKLTPMIDDATKFRIYVSALTQISIDEDNRIPTTDNRLLRRIIRDHNYRNYTAAETIERWPSVRKGEEKNIFPYQEEADVMFNSALLYELSVLKMYAEPLLHEIQENQHVYSEADRLLKFLSYFLPVADHEVPPTSIIREFVGQSSFYY